MKITLFFFAFLIPHTLCIIGGKDAEASSESNFVVSLGGSSHFCGGALIEYNFVLTAASCVKDKKLEDFYGHIGSKDLNNDQEGVTVHFDKVFFKEPTGQKQVRNNIAILRLKKAISTNDQSKVRLIEYSSNEVTVGSGDWCRIFGWGKTANNSHDPSMILQQMDTNLEDPKNCKFQNNDVDESNICTYSRTASLCDFDEGSPLFSSNVVWGIATQAHACSKTPILADVFTRVESHKDWIKKTMDENLSAWHKPQPIITSTGIIAVVLMTWLYL